MGEVVPLRPVTAWHEIAPADAVGLNLSVRLDITAPVNEMGVRCPWPWEPQQLIGVPLGQYRCPWCGAGVIAGMPHLDYVCVADPPCPHPDTAHELVAVPGRDEVRARCDAPGCRCGHPAEEEGRRAD